MTKAYQITHLIDILDVPSENLEELIVDIRKYHMMLRPVIEAGMDKADISGMTFIPDGKGNATIGVIQCK